MGATMLKTSVLVFAALILFPVAQASAAQKATGKKSSFEACKAREMTNCPATGMARRSCIDAALARCRK
jgi:hypothetical protein